MGRSNSFNKKELEKKRAKKRKEKEKRKEERKASGSSGSLDDMIAYVDENGVITSEQPEPGSKQKVEMKDIAISTPKRQDQDNVILKGRVEHFNSDKGYGFIKDITNTEKYFFHITDAFPDIKEGAMVSFELVKGNRGLNAVKIEPSR